MWLFNKKIKESYDAELLKQDEPYQYYLDKEQKCISNDNKGEHENVPLIYMEENVEKTDLHIEKVAEDERYTTYECDDYFIYENKKGYSTDVERRKLVTEAKKLNADLIYTDIDHIDCNGKRSMPFFKSCYGIDTFKCFDYYSDFYAIKKMKSKMDIACLEKIEHIPEVLFHYNYDEVDLELKNKRYYNNNSYQTDDFYICNLVNDADKEKISVIIPSKDNPHLIKICLEGICKSKIKSGINVLEVIIVDNGSTEEHRKEISDVIESATSTCDGLKCEYIYEPADFNFSAMCNEGVKNSSGKYLLFMNDDIEVTDELFLLKLLFFAKMDHVGAVSCKLLYPGEEKRIQHVGITCLKYAGPSHKLSTFTDDKTLYFGRNIGVHNCLAVTGACLMVSSEKYFKIGGFYDKMKVGYNDVDLCISLYENGFVNVVNNECVLIHHESITRGSDAASEDKLKRLDNERSLLYERHPWLLTDGDPYYNPNLAEDFLDYRLNVIPDFERRDYVSIERTEYMEYVNKLESKSSDELPSTKNMFLSIDDVSCFRGYLEIKGWSLINKKHNYMFDTYVVVPDGDNKWHAFETAKVRRKDLQDVFPEAKTTELSGFFARISLESLGGEKLSDRNRFGVLLINKQTGKKYYAGFRKSDI